jgi:adenylate cyclase
MRLDEFADFVGMPTAEVERVRESGLLDLDRDGLFDQMDVMRLHYVQAETDRGASLADVAAAVKDGRIDFPFFGDYLFATGRWRVPVEEAARRVGLIAAQVEELRTCLGLPGGALKDEDVDALRSVRTILDAGVPWESVLEGARVYGDSLRRIADWEINVMHKFTGGLSAVQGSRDEAGQKLLDLLGMVVEPMVQFIHREHMLRAALEHMLIEMKPPEERSPTTIEFVDLSSFTALASVHGDEIAAEVLERFDTLVRSLVQTHNGRLIKQIGDAFMLTFSEPADAVRFAVDLLAAAADQENFPAVKIGIHAGPVLYRVGDYVGTTVNIASRLASAAMPHEIVLSEAVADEAETAGIGVAPLGMRMMRGISEPLALYRVTPKERIPRRDPVCGMILGEDVAGVLVRDGVEYAFCSEDCLRHFLDDPARYAIAR